MKEKDVENKTRKPEKEKKRNKMMKFNQAQIKLKKSTNRKNWHIVNRRRKIYLVKTNELGV